MEITKRSDINVGYSCNLRCKFCYYGESLDSCNDKSTEEIKKLLRFLRRHGKDAVDFTGGEPTIRKDIFEIINYAKEIGFKTICLITNGQKLDDKDFAKKLVDAGANDFLFSIHECDEKNYDNLTRVPGSFKRLINGAKNIRDLKVKLRTNTTVNKKNYKNLLKISNILLELKPSTINFLLFNPSDDSIEYKEEMLMKFSEAAPHIKKAIDYLKQDIKKINVRFIPFCFMRGYEKHVLTAYQENYDEEDWDEIIREKINGGFFLTNYHVLRGLIRLHPKKWVTNNLSGLMHDAFVKGISIRAVKNLECKKCRCNHICIGLNKEYAELYGLDELKAIEGKPIFNPAYLIEEEL